MLVERPKPNWPEAAQTFLGELATRCTLETFKPGSVPPFEDAWRIFLDVSGPLGTYELRVSTTAAMAIHSKVQLRLHWREPPKELRHHALADEGYVREYEGLEVLMEHIRFLSCALRHVSRHEGLSRVLTLDGDTRITAHVQRQQFIEYVTRLNENTLQCAS